jgi:hypothetical protein
VRRPVDNAKYIVVELDFETVQAAEAFKEFLETVSWQSGHRPCHTAGLVRTSRESPEGRMGRAPAVTPGPFGRSSIATTAA